MTVLKKPTYKIQPGAPIKPYTGVIPKKLERLVLAAQAVENDEDIYKFVSNHGFSENSGHVFMQEVRNIANLELVTWKKNWKPTKEGK